MIQIQEPVNLSNAPVELSRQVGLADPGGFHGLIKSDFRLAECGQGDEGALLSNA